MSSADIVAERSRAAMVLAATGLPLLGMTIGTDGAWSARLWPRVAPKTYKQTSCSGVRVVGRQLRVTFHPVLLPAPVYRDELRRTISMWGERPQSELARLHVGVVGVGSVGRLVVEALARIGVRRVTIIDFDRVEPHNLDRLLGAHAADAKSHRLKVDVAREGFLQASNAADPDCRGMAASVVELEGYSAALNCDVLFSCVDRPWPRRVLNHLAFAHLIPVIDGGILVRMKGEKFRGAEWSVRTTGPGRACLVCAGAYDPSHVELERNGNLEDPSYAQGLDPDHPLRRSENVFPFSMALAAHEIIQFVAMCTALLKMPDLGDQRYHYNLREMRSADRVCKSGCEFQRITSTGDSEYPSASFLGIHAAARASQAQTISSAAETGVQVPAEFRANRRSISLFERFKQFLLRT
jgi:molybdopterin-synthase adenylyltransferase